ncbi:MAG: hypothetical protein R3209_09395, partial [Salinimicrobium sediminis]|nr:hypothetical protein [Salinimicrobium sediminis]
ETWSKPVLKGATSNLNLLCALNFFLIELCVKKGRKYCTHPFPADPAVLRRIFQSSQSFFAFASFARSLRPLRETFRNYYSTTQSATDSYTKDQFKYNFPTFAASGVFLPYTT